MHGPTAFRDNCSRVLYELFLEHLFHVADLALHLAACFFDGPSIAQVWIPRRLAGLFFHFAFRFFKGALNFILCA